jgi:hypothetical protein
VLLLLLAEPQGPEAEGAASVPATAEEDEAAASVPATAAEDDAAASVPAQDVADAAESVPATAAEADRAASVPLEEFRVPFDDLVERTVGAAAKPVRFDWRKSTAGVAFIGSQLSELNNFRSLRVGLLARMPTGDSQLELAVTRVFTSDSEATKTLALTPYRQWGRPSRWELDLNWHIALAEGVTTFALAFLPAAQLVLNGVLGFRYLLYSAAFADASAGEVLESLLSPQLSARELHNLNGERPPAMQIDRARFGVMGGLSADLFFYPMGFLQPRALFALPLLSSALGSNLSLWWELSLAAGVQY